MNSDPKNKPITDEVRQRCMQYLLGELDSDQSALFEKQIGESDEIQNELLSQASLVAAIGSQAVPTPAVKTSGHSLWPKIAAVAALAASLLIAFAIQPNQVEQETASNEQPEGLLIAQAFAGVSVISDSEVPTLDETPAPLNEDESDEDASLSWMIAAIEAGAASDG